jgi:hypothetical protein
MDPIRAEFNGNLEMCRELIASKPDDPGLRPFLSQLDRIEQQANAAYTTKNRRNWANINETLLQLRSRIEKIVNGGREDDGGGPRKLPPPDVLKDQARMQIEQMRATLRTNSDNVSGEPDFERWQKRCEVIERDLDTMEKAVERISSDLSPEQCLGQIQQALLKERDIKKKISLIKPGADTRKA